jgi:hypothetical protein
MAKKRRFVHGPQIFSSHKEAEEALGPEPGQRYRIAGDFGHHYTGDVLRGGSFDPQAGFEEHHGKFGGHKFGKGKFGHKGKGKFHRGPFSSQDDYILGHAGIPGGHAGFGK